jgi:dihydrodipicolinate reductase
MTKVVVIGGTGLIGSKVVARLAEHGHEAIAASPKSGVNTLTGEGLAEVLSGAQVVVDVSNSPSFEDKAALDFFTTSTGNLLAAEKTAGVGHHVALSVVGTERLPESGYLRAKLAQEKLIKESGISYSIVHAPSSSSSSRILPTRQPTATWFAFPTPSSNPSRLPRSPARLQAPRLASPSTEPSRSPDQSSLVSMS